MPDSPTPKRASSRTPAFSRAGGGISPSTDPSPAESENRRLRAEDRVPKAEVPEAGSQEPQADPWLPESKLPPLPKRSINSLIRNILLTTPVFPRFYADTILRAAPNSREAKILRPHYQKICEKVKLIMSQNGTCTHIKVTGVRCGSPALKGEEFCYFHQNAHRTVRRPKQSRLHPIALIEDEESIQYALMEVINALMRNTIDLKRATLILRALHIAVKNATRVKYSIHTKDMVTEIPKYPEPQPEEDFAEITPIDLPAVAANPNLPVSPEGPHCWEQKAEAARQIARDEAQRFAAEAKSREEARKRFAEERAAEARAREKAIATTTTRVGTGAFARPASASAASASAPLQTAYTPDAPADVPAHNFRKPSQPTQSTKPAPRKPPTSATKAPRERKNSAQRASAG